MSVKQHKSKKNKGYESISRDFLQRNDLSLEARGLLAYMQSMPEGYIFHKTQLYKCFEKNKRTAIERIWNELLDAQFIIAFSKGVGPKQEYDYIYSQEGFSEEEIQELNEEYLKDGWEIAYRSGSNRKPASYYDERKKAKSLPVKKDYDTNVNQELEAQFPDSEYNSVGVDSEQFVPNYSKPTDIKFNTKDLLKKDDDDDENNNKRKNINSDSEKSQFEKTVENEKLRLQKEYGDAVASGLIKSAELYTSEHLHDMKHYWDYLLVALQNEEEKYKKFTLEPQQQDQEFYIPLDGPWNAKNENI